jgi:hypothetical protein
MFRTILFSVLLTLGVPGSAFADDPKPVEPGPWQFSGGFGVNLAQSAYSDNWHGGEAGSFAWVALASLAAERQFSMKFNLANKLQATYGQTAQQVPDPADPRLKKWDTPEKSSDYLAFESVGRFTLRAAVDPFVAFRAETQFTDASSPIGKIPFNPITLKETAGVARMIVKTDTSEVLTRLGLATRQIFAKSFTDPVTKDKERFTSTDGGIDWQTNIKHPVLKRRVLYTSQLIVYKPLFYSKSDDLQAFDVLADSAAAARGTTHGPVSDFWKEVEVDFLNVFTSQITKVLSVNLLVQWVYDKFDEAANVDPTLPFDVQEAEIDKNVRKAGQFKETLGLGLTYKF